MTAASLQHERLTLRAGLGASRSFGGLSRARLPLERADRVLHRQSGRPLVGVGDRNEPANRVGARLDVELLIAAGPEQPPL